MAGRECYRDRLDAGDGSRRDDARRRGELPGFPHLPELPARGPGADLTGRTASLVVDIPVETSPRGWRLSERPGRDLNRARTMLSSDLDVMEEVLDGYRGLVKVQLCGPWTLAATLELPRTLNVAIADPGAVADLTASLAEGAAAHVAEIAKRLPGAQVAVQFDEPALAAVAGGEVPTASGLSRLRPVEAEVLRDRLAQVIAAVQGYTVVHSCATAVPFGLIQTAGAGRRPSTSASYGGATKRTGSPRPPRPAWGRRSARCQRSLSRTRTQASSAAHRRSGARRAQATAAPRPARPRNGSSGCTTGSGSRWPPARTRL